MSVAWISAITAGLTSPMRLVLRIALLTAMRAAYGAIQSRPTKTELSAGSQALEDGGPSPAGNVPVARPGV